MRTLSLLKGMPVYLSNGELFGEVCDIGISAEGKVTCLLCKKDSFFGKNCRIAISHVQSFGQHGIVLHEDTQIEKYKDRDNEYTLYHSNPLMKKLALSTSGDQLGLLEDVYFSEELGKIIGYELTDGFFTDMLEGKKVIQVNGPPKIGKDAIIVSVKQLRGGLSYDEMSKLPK
ncbi:PRC-barrel domain-containing protein [Heyndrickxia oleronia]|uniref:Photosystem reaction center subunit H n=2 Tax=Heyndrickxia oleronia TaxID=38875 RepID=A0A8E2I4X1_9BACI|nr:PRC-barrel domain-containing protein [Heyndrickxia oleronia]NYV64487.1 PRC-barrel domain-containing protein [Bacillus sp. Gen3]OJH20433.1 photosystem reaction center subunit H [Bacillus obstructivus]MCI1590307.1 PRC-barrel domain-containing protein [Heyndrickxia oleronia]MCI1614089.1 PRC-barrel domain-containing protein [Heyndrickxia oleronia]MCI1745243.1 PRC-barrel domain-containing protein [Heyndrickxia oleronia]